VIGHNRIRVKKINKIVEGQREKLYSYIGRMDDETTIAKSRNEMQSPRKKSTGKIKKIS
jgi:hypothetical protein